MLDNPIGLWRRQTKTADGKRMNVDIVALFQSKPLTFSFCHSLDYARGNESVLYFTDICKPIETYIYARKKHPFASYPAAKHPKHSKFPITARGSILALAVLK